MRSSPFAALDRSLAAAPDPARVGFLYSHDVAHRGLWGGPIPENSLAAAHAAVQGGFGIECDVRLSRDGTVMVFHDADTERLTGKAGRIANMATHDIQALRLGGGEERVPTLAQLTGLIAGACPCSSRSRPIPSPRPRRSASRCAACWKGIAGRWR